MGYKIMSGAGSNHSGASATFLGIQYSFLLNDWDGWVKTVKLREAKEKYNELQLERPSTWEFIHAQTQEKRKDAIQRLRVQFSLAYSDEEISQMITELVDEFNETSRLQILRDEEDRFKSGLDVLEHHYEYPERWDDYGVGMLKSFLFGSIYGITEDMFKAMEKKHSDYRGHIENIIKPHHSRCACGLCHRRRVAQGTDGEYYAWVQEESTKVLKPV
jgi:hypothetical protein